MSNGIFTLPEPYNEPIRDYAPGSPERASLKAAAGGAGCEPRSRSR